MITTKIPEQEDLTYMGFFDDIPIFEDKSIKEKNTAYLLDLEAAYTECGIVHLGKGKLILMRLK